MVVGIDDYEHVADLTKAANDARSVSGVLNDIGFEVTTLLDPDERRFNRQLADFTAAIDPGDEVVFYFAGHGIEIDGQNYLLPSDAPDSPSERVIRSDSINADEVLRDLQRAGASVAVMILDACRDNPYSGSGRSIGGARGLSIVAPPVGSFVLMSAAAGQLAFEGDDDDPNSIFTRALLPLLHEPGLTLPELARQMRRDVSAFASELGHRQQPAYYDEVAGDFFFMAAAPPVEETHDASRSLSADELCSVARQDWDRLGSNPPRAVLEAFIATHAECSIYRLYAQDRLVAADAAREDLASRLSAALNRAETAEAASADSARQVALLNEQVAALRTQLVSLQSLLDEAAERDADADVQISTLGAALNTALAQLATEQRARADLEAAEAERLAAEAAEREREQSLVARRCTGTVVDLRPVSLYDRAAGHGFLAVRLGPGANFRQLGELYLGDEISVLERSSNWYLVQCTFGQCLNPLWGEESPSGWVYGRYVSVGGACP